MIYHDLLRDGVGHIHQNDSFSLAGEGRRGKAKAPVFPKPESTMKPMLQVSRIMTYQKKCADGWRQIFLDKSFSAQCDCTTLYNEDSPFVESLVHK